MSELVDADGDRPIGFAKHNGAGEIIFRQAGHPSYDATLLAEHWKPVWLDPSTLPSPDGFVYVDEGWWAPNVKSGQVHDHPVNPNGNWYPAHHRECEPVYTKRAVK